ncbi:hypothetical protein HRI_000409000 [Hibiscus trionum]|uniref:RNase H type-1 domain-containing protein n=1 Tax=Hibiscus trionum TaxID=183268 RepID=A0A9W7LK61_HIBTR|nr:hypothetical protein HRI_000409000 [Hibiscus trionum]
MRNDARRALNMQPVVCRAHLPGTTRHCCNKPPPGWIKINIDSARNSSTGVASCGGVERDEIMQWRFGFSKKIGICSSFDAEL